MHVSQKFEHLLNTYPRPDGRGWSGAELEKATGGVVQRFYVINLGNSNEFTNTLIIRTGAGQSPRIKIY